LIVLVAMPSLKLDHIDFDWVKKCRKPQLLRQALELLKNEPFPELRNAVERKLNSLVPNAVPRDPSRAVRLMDG